MVTCCNGQVVDLESPIPRPLSGWSCLRHRLELVRSDVLLCVLGLAPLLLAYFQDLWARPQYQFFPLARISHDRIEQRSGESVRRLDITQPNDNATRRFFCDRL
jgi:hypothetical protein